MTTRPCAQCGDKIEDGRALHCAGEAVCSEDCRISRERNLETLAGIDERKWFACGELSDDGRR